MDNADIGWMLVATALVLLMTPALGVFYGGMVRSKNALNTMMRSFVGLGPVAVAWALAGYSLAFAPGGPFIGSFSYVGMRGVGLEAQGAIPPLLFMTFQGTFAIITTALISGAIVERLRFGSYVAFVVAWMLLVYAPVAHWVWGGGFLATAGALDYAGGAVVHVNAAAAALVAALVVGPRKDYGRHAILPHNVPFTLLGAAGCGIGWFGFNAGSALAASPAAALAFANTLLRHHPTGAAERGARGAVPCRGARPDDQPGAGHGGEMEHVENYRGTTVKMALAEKVRLEIGVSNHFVQPTVDAILAGARTGEVGDGKILVLPIETIYRIRTGEQDQDAVTPVPH